MTCRELLDGEEAGRVEAYAEEKMTIRVRVRVSRAIRVFLFCFLRRNHNFLSTLFFVVFLFESRKERISSFEEIINLALPF